VANAVVWPDVFERYRGIVLRASLLAIEGRLQREEKVIHVVAEHMVDLTDRLHELSAPVGDDPARSFDAAQARADEVKRPGPDPADLARRPNQLRRHPRNVNLMPKSRDFH